jgi:hypothetical protein
MLTFISLCFRRGTKIHKQLEREIHPVEIKVAVNSKEETWALRVGQTARSQAPDDYVADHVAPLHLRSLTCSQVSRR